MRGRRLLGDSCSRTTAFIRDELYPEVWLSPDLGGLTGHLLGPFSPNSLRMLFMNVKTLNRTKNRLPSRWTDKLSGEGGTTLESSFQGWRDRVDVREVTAAGPGLLDLTRFCYLCSQANCLWRS